MEKVFSLFALVRVKQRKLKNCSSYLELRSILFARTSQANKSSSLVLDRVG